MIIAERFLKSTSLDLKSMKFDKVLLVLLALALLGCTQHSSDQVEHGIVKFAKNFQIEFHDGYKILKVKEDETWKTYILYYDKPPEGVEGIPIKIPIKRMVVMSSTHIAQLEAINGTDAVVGFMYGGRYKLYFPDVVERLEKGEIVDLGSPNAPDYEKLIELNPDIVIIYVTSSNEKVREKLRELGINYIVDSEWLENDPLGRAEWVKFFGALLDKDEEAEEYFNRIVKNVEEIEEAVSSVEEKPNVLWALIYKGRVYVPRGDSYVAKMIEYAGGNYLFKDVNGAGSEIINIEDLLLKGQKADVMIYSSYYVKSLDDIKRKEPRMADLKVFKERKIYNITPDYWQLGLLHPDIVIRDLAAILHPELFKDYEPRFFVRLT